MFNNRANRSVQDLQTQSQREKLSAHAPHISRGAISQHTTHNTKHTTSASRSRYKRNNTRRQHAAATKHAQTKTPPKGNRPKRDGRKNVGARRQRLGAKSQKAGSTKAGGQNTASAQRRGARSHSLKRTKAGGETLRQSGGNIPAKLIFYPTLTRKIQNTFLSSCIFWQK